MHLKSPLNSTSLFHYIFCLHLNFTYIRDLLSCDFSVHNADFCMWDKGSNTHIFNLELEIKYGMCLNFWLHILSSFPIDMCYKFLVCKIIYVATLAL